MRTSRIIDASPKRSIGDQGWPTPKPRRWSIENSRAKVQRLSPGCLRNLLSLVAGVALHGVDIGLCGLFLLVEYRVCLLTGSHLVAGYFTFLLLGIRGTSMNTFADFVLDVLAGIHYVFDHFIPR